ncbi:hypothetical protein Q5H93_21655 [Hymenobacter sp. ASUV-10]|uniref:Uncharacterized protein n=1 Tax=Hymenobacter aranciens TaxID=3063996 RepID=A0ABT9BK32_9BACT|nr:hypothetical protein [Hymenobacter sp. ASUV-10]MDO7877362.1 hypothetical protein [Hymenobacter sp. ASUV-10]
MTQAGALTRQANTENRNRKIRNAFYDRYTNKPRPRQFSREYVISQLAEEYNLSMTTVENILYKQEKAPV